MQMRRRVGLIASLSVLVVVSMAVRCSAVDLSEIAEKGAEQCRRFGSIEYRVHPPFGSDYRYIHDGGKFRLDTFSANVKQPSAQPTQIFSFDGSKYYQKHSSTLVTATTPAADRVLPISSNPLYATLYWLFAARNEYTWSVACNATAWSEVLAKGTFQKDEAVNGIPCHVVRLDFPHANTDVWFARDQGCFPVKWSCFSKKSGELLSQAEIVQHKVVQSEGVELFVPVQSRFSQAAAGGAKALDQTSVIEVASLRVNEPVDQDLFTLVATPQMQVLDGDELALAAKDREGSLGDKSVGSGRLWLIGLNLVVIGVLAATILWSARRNRT